jgi:selenocysteine-specific elongation factor
MPLIGTAGHVDHGKSTLVERLTGRDPDRWAEEKRRGMTIDLGFAWATLPDGSEVSFVDVPGHERFVKNMLAGIESIDVALFVVAADEGWMPQSEEHLAVLDMLDVDRGVVALTKIDNVDLDMQALAALEVSERLAGTSLAEASVIPVSARSGQGIDELVSVLGSLLPGDDGDIGRPRLWVDRSFPVAGAGTIVTGSLVGGSLRREETVEVHPKGLRGRVRSLQSHEREQTEVRPGRRVALNLGGIGHDQVGRGDMLGLPGHWRTTRRFAGTVRKARYTEEFEQRGAYQMHVGSTSHQVRLSGLDGGLAVFTIENEVPLAVGDRYVIRDTGRHLVVAGGRVLDPAPGKTNRALRSAAFVDPDAPPDDLAAALLAIRGRDRVDRLAAHTGGGTAPTAMKVGDLALDENLVSRLLEQTIAMVDEEHEAHPLRPGLSLATLAERLEVEVDVAEALVDRMPDLVRSGPTVSRAGRVSTLSPDQEQSWDEAVLRLGRGLDVPAEGDLGLDGDVVALKLKTGDLVRVGPGLVYLRSQVEELRSLIAECGDGFTVAQFRDVAGLSRKYAVPILEWSDAEGLTVRRGDVRHLR